MQLLRNLIFTIFIFVAGCTASDTPLHCFMFDVDQANFELLIKDNKALVVDCGSRKKDWTVSGKFSSTKQALIKNLLEKVNDIKIVISHDHDDHQNLLFALSKCIIDINSSREAGKKISSGGNAITIVNEGADDETINGMQILYGWQEDVDFAKRFLEKSLGDAVSVIPVRPKEYPTFGPIGKHNSNLLVLVSFGASKLLFPGDADCTLLTKLNSSREEYFNPELLQGINFILMPHHGSAEHGELLWFDFVKRYSVFLLAVASSNPFTKDRLPSEFSPELIFPNWHPDYRESLEHEISIRLPDGNGQIVKTKRPLFTTCSASSGYYTLSAFSNSALSLYDGKDEVTGWERKRDKPTTYIG